MSELREATIEFERLCAMLDEAAVTGDYERAASLGRVIAECAEAIVDLAAAEEERTVREGYEALRRR